MYFKTIYMYNNYEFSYEFSSISISHFLFHKNFTRHKYSMIYQLSWHGRQTPCQTSRMADRLTEISAIYKLY